MYSAVAERGREIATIRALGFGSGAVISSFLIEGLLISLAGGAIGCLAILPLNGLTTVRRTGRLFLTSPLRSGLLPTCSWRALPSD